MEHLKETMSEKSKRLLQLSTEKGVSNWLTRLPIAGYGFELSKQQFWNSIYLRYGLEISKLSTTCPCGSKFDIQHSMSCKKWGFVTIRHNDLRDFRAKISSEVCYNTEIEPTLVPLSGEDLSNQNAYRTKQDLTFEHVIFGKEDSEHFFWFKGVRPQRLLIFQKNTATVSCYKRKWEEKGI